ncbi:sugar porter family MFS transporter [Actinomycetes bacterium NPDC127524]
MGSIQNPIEVNAIEKSSKKGSINIKFIILVSVVAAVGGLMFGYDTAVISGAEGFIQQRFHLTDVMIGWVVSSLLLGAIIGTAAGGILSDKYGRKRMLFVSAIFYGIGAIYSAIPSSVAELVFARLIGGVGVGMAVFLAPLYIAEIAPANWRGRLGSLDQLAISIGQSVVFFINAAVANQGGQHWNVTTGWRWMLGIGAAPAIIFFFLLFFVKESPRWLEKKGRSDEALQILNRIHLDGNDAKKEHTEIKDAISKEDGSIKDIFKPGLRKALMIGVVVAFLSQWAGINAIMYYAPKIFQAGGSNMASAFMQTTIMGVVMVVFTILGLLLMDRVGRTKLISIGTAVMAICLFGIGLSFSLGQSTGLLILVFILLYMAAFMTTIGPGMWVLLSEIFPTRIRGLAMSISTVALWVADYIVSQIFPVLLQDAGPGITFFIFAAGSAIISIFTIKVIPETRNKSLEEIERMFVRTAK